MNRYQQILFALFFGALLLGCTPVEVTPTTQATAAAPVQVTRQTPTSTAPSSTLTPIATRPLLMETSTLAAASIPTPTTAILPFAFQGTIVLSIIPNREINESSLWLLDSPNTELQPLLSEDGVIFAQPLLSPTGRYLAYQRDVGDSTSIWVLDMTTGETKQWSENFEFIYMDLQGSPHLLNGIEIQSWTPDEKALVFQYWEEQVALDEPVWSYILFEDGRTQQLGSRILDVSWSANEPNNLVYLSEFGRI